MHKVKNNEREKISHAMSILEKYRQGKASFETRIVSEEKAWRQAAKAAHEACRLLFR